jgi:hypothetical protein
MMMGACSGGLVCERPSHQARSNAVSAQSIGTHPNSVKTLMQKNLRQAENANIVALTIHVQISNAFYWCIRTS